MIMFHRELPLYALMDSSFRFDIINLGWSIVCIKGSKVIIYKIIFISISKDHFCLSK